MEPSPDDLAGVVDLFGALTAVELEQALAELAFKRGEDPPEAQALIEDALATYHLVAVEGGDGADAGKGGADAREDDADDAEDGVDGVDDEPLLVAGPTAFPALPDGAGDLPHIMDDAGASVHEDEQIRAAEERFREDTAGAVANEDEERIRTLLDVSYELEVWGDLDLAALRERLDDALE